MNQPLVPSLGNALEVAEVMQVLTGQVSGPLVELSAALGGVVLADAGLADDVQAGADAIVGSIRDGRAAERFGRMVAAMGGPVQFVENWKRFLPEATVVREVGALTDGYINAIDGEALGLAVVALGGGRRVETDDVDLAVGLEQVVRIGQQVRKGQPLAVVHAARPDAADRAVRAVRAAVSMGPEAVSQLPVLIHDRVD
jgi:thymidine phosphorylase